MEGGAGALINGFILFNNYIQVGEREQHEAGVHLCAILWGGYDWLAPSIFRSLLQNIISFKRLFCIIDLQF